MGIFEKAGGTRLGWGLLVAWLFCTFYTWLVPVGRLADDPAAPLFFQMLGTILALSFAILAILVLIAAERRQMPFLRAPWLPVVSGALAGAGTLVVAFSADVAPVVVGDALTGFGSSALWMLWGEEYTRGADEESETAALASAVVAAAFTALANALVPAAALVLVCLLPVASGGVLILGRRGEGGDGEGVPISESEGAGDRERPALSPFWGAFLKSGVALFAMCAFLSLLQGLCPDFEHGSPLLYAGLAASVAFVLVVGYLSLSGPRRVSVSFLFRWAVPLVITGFALIVVFGAPSGYAMAYTLSIMGRLAFCAVTQLYFSRFVERGMASAMVAYGVGWLFLHVGDLVGTCASVALVGLVTDGSLAPDQVAGACIVCVAFCSLIPFGRDPGFAPARVSAPEPMPVQEDSPERADDTEGAYERRIAALAAEYKLTPREAEIFCLLMHGRSVPFIRDELVISRDTVATHVKHIYSKTGVHSRQELLDLAQ